MSAPSEDNEYEQAKRMGEDSQDRPMEYWELIKRVHGYHTPSSEDEERHEELQRYRDTSKMRNRLGYWILGAVIAQVSVLDICMSVYLGCNIHSPNQAIIIAWLTTNFTEIVGILIVVARSIFPSRAARIKDRTSK